jgi:hypothetical protein
MDLKISKKESGKWISRWINNVNTVDILETTITTTDFKGNKSTHTFDPSVEWITEVKYYNVHKPEGADEIAR